MPLPDERGCKVTAGRMSQEAWKTFKNVVKCVQFFSWQTTLDWKDCLNNCITSSFETGVFWCVCLCRKKNTEREALHWREEEVLPREREKWGFRGRERVGWLRGQRERGQQQNASISSKTSLGPLQRVCLHVCTLVCFCPVGINTLQSHCVLRWTPPWRPMPSKHTSLLLPPSLSPLLSSWPPSILLSSLSLSLSLSTLSFFFFHFLMTQDAQTQPWPPPPPPPFSHLWLPCLSSPVSPSDWPQFLLHLCSPKSEDFLQLRQMLFLKDTWLKFV